MLRSKGLNDKLLLLGIDGMDPRFTKRLVDEGKLPNVKKLMEMGSCRNDLMLLGANPSNVGNLSHRRFSNDSRNYGL